MKPLTLITALLIAVAPAYGEDKTDPKKPKTSREKRAEQEKKIADDKAAKEKKAADEKAAREKKSSDPAKPSSLPPKSGLAPKAGLPSSTDKPMTDAEMVTVLKPFDKNGDYQIDIIEFTDIETEFKKHSQGPLKQFDKGKDGALDALIDRAYMNVKLGAATPPKTATPPAPPPAPAAPKAPDATKPAAPAPTTPPKAPDASKPAAPAPAAPAPDTK